jgi:hypothetical protein
LRRRLPHLTCVDFLPHLGDPFQWQAGRHAFDAAGALALIWDHVRANLPANQGIAASLPGYLTAGQAAIVAEVAQRAKLAWLGSLPTALAAVWVSQEGTPWHGLALVLEADDHSLTWSAVQVDEQPRQARLLAAQAVPDLGLRVWQQRLSDGIADRCIRQSRRDPRESAAAEQRLYEQLDGVLEACRADRLAKLTIESERWYQELLVAPEEILHYCPRLVRQATCTLNRILEVCQAEQLPQQVLVTAEADRLPGLVPALAEQLGAGTGVTILPAEGIARAALALANRWHGGGLPKGHLEVLPLSVSETPAAPQRGWSWLPRRQDQTKLPPRPAKPSPAEDDFSITVDD